MSIRHTQVFPYVCSNPISDVFHVHGNDIRFVLAWTWHVKVLCTRVELHAKSELSLLLTLGVVWISRIREVKVAWNVILWSWNSHELHLVTLLLLNVSDLGRQLCSIVDRRTLACL